MRIYSFLSLLLGGIICLANWIWFYQAVRDRLKGTDPHPTPPLVGAFFLGVGLAGFEATRPYALLAIVADWGTLYLLISTPRIIVSLFRDRRSFHRGDASPNENSEHTGHS